MDFRVFHGKNGLTRIAADWRRLCDRRPNLQFFHHVDWYGSYVDGLLEDDAALCFIALYEAGELQAIFPLQRKRQRAFGMERRMLELPFYFRLRLWDFIVAPEAETAGTFRALVAFLRRTPELRWDVLRLRETVADGAADRMIRAARPALLVAEPAGYSNVLPLLAYEETRRRLPKKFRENLNNVRNRVKRAGGGRVLHSRDPDKLRALYPELVRIEASGWKGAAGTALRDLPAFNRFFGNVVERLGVAGQCEITALEVDGRMIAAQLGTITGDTYCSHKIAYDETYARLSPGHLLLDDLMQRYAGHRDLRFVNLITDAAWQAPWRPDRVAVTDYYLYRNSPQGLSAYLAYGGRLAARGFGGRLRRRLSRERGA